MNNSMISVIVPVYNVEKYLSKCLDSIINQTYQNLEIICVDDGSTDSSPMILEEYAKKDSRIKIITRQNGGLSAARNTGVKNATGEFVSFVDSDDWIDLETYEKAIRHFSEGVDSVCWYAALVCEEGVECDFDGEKNWHRVKFSGKTTLDGDSFFKHTFTVWNKLWRRSIIEKYKIDFPEGIIHEDFSFYTKYMALAPKTYFLNEYLYFYRKRKNSIMHSVSGKTPNHLFDTLKNFELVYDFFEKNGLLVKNEVVLTKMFRLALNDNYRDASDNDKRLVLNYAADLVHKISLGDYWNNNEVVNIVRKRKYWKLKDYLELDYFNEKKPFLNIFSVAKTEDKKIVRLLGIKLSFKRRKSLLKKTLEEQKKDFISLLLDNIFASKKSIYKSFEKETTFLKDIKRPLDERILNSLKELDDFFFYPNNGNLGDVVIAESEYQMLEDNKFSYRIYDAYNSPNDIDDKPFDLVYGGGGLFVKYWNYQQVKEIFEKQNLRKAVILPSSFYECDDLLDVLDERFIVFCREKRSFDYCISKNSRAKFFLTDDMAFSLDLSRYRQNSFDKNLLKKNLEDISDENLMFLYKELYQIYKSLFRRVVDELKLKTVEQKGKKVGYFMRGDEEKSISELYVPAIDLSLFACSSCTDSGVVRILSKLFMQAIDSVEVVVTDRLHVGLVATLLGKKVFLFDNSYGKVSGIFEQSLKFFENVKILNSPDEIKSELNSVCDSITSSDVRYCDMLSYEEFLKEYLSSTKDTGKLYNTIWC